MERYDGTSGPSRPGDSAESGGSTSSQPAMPRVLVVEDQALIALALVADLAAIGCEVVGRAGSGEAAVALARRQAPDIVVMDVHLAGGMDGIAAATLIKAECSPRLVFVTAYADGPDRARMEALRPVAILGKPYHPNELNLAINVCARQRMRRHAHQPAAGIAD